MAQENFTMVPSPTATDERPFAFLRVNERPPKPRTRRVTEIRALVSGVATPTIVIRPQV
jgi:hypothetical protein